MKILIVDDHFVFREGIHLLLKQFNPVFEIVEASNGREALSLIRSNPPDVILMDSEMPEMNGTECLKELKQGDFSFIPVIMLTMHDQLNHMILMHDLGANGYLTKDSSIKEVVLAIETVTQGEEYYAAVIRTPFLKELSKREHTFFDKTNKLTAREVEVLQMICQEFSTEEIAANLFVSPLTINNHRRSLIAKTGAKNVAGLVMYAIKNGLFVIE
ncbi:response regulator transcription factor [Fluviicola chungangensis]|uniref:Response regulator transcription factor n=1 Tax=Fluviicola chungangensis TaxID=2597671 RepID=A0A556MYN4_9FLAO|nr:response regulator transcription factor [Fluviicola chungangensis]TSJ44938.1 response regulator transcription factor [Fluviicola chungangensis]